MQNDCGARPRAVRGLLVAVPVHLAGAGRGTDRLQTAITNQAEEGDRQRLDAEIMALPVEDHRREAWVSVDSLSSQFISSWPTESLACTRAEFREMYTTYFGVPSPVCRPLAGRILPTAEGGPFVVLDLWGQELSAAQALCLRLKRLKWLKWSDHFL